MMNDNTNGELVGLLKEWEAAIVSNDAGAIAEFMADDWVLVTPETGVVERSRFLEAIATGHLTHAAMQSDPVRVRTYDNVAVLTVRGTNNGTFMGQPFSADEWITDVMMKLNGRWRCVLTHLTPAQG
jgi:uncharacterized protein (TIGR02246 family)